MEPSTQPAAAKKRVLLVDDDKFLLDMYANKFIASGFDAMTSVGGNEALTKLREGAEVDVIVLDIIMPGLDGLELLETIRKEKIAPNAVIVMLTNETDPAKIEKAKSFGVAGYIVKATSIPSEVVTEVTNILNAHK